DLAHVAGGVPDFIDDGGIDAVKHARENFLGVLNHDAENGDGNDQTYNRISERVAEPDSGGSDKDCQACPTIDTCVIAVGDERRAFDLTTHLDAENRDRFVSDETDDRGQRHGP